MRYTFLVVIVELLMLAVIISAVIMMPDFHYLYISAAAIVMVLVILLYSWTGLPLRKIETGMNLLIAQDFSSQLCKTGQTDADRIIDIFNDMMLRLRRQTLQKHEQDNFLKQLIDVSPMGVITLELNERIDLVNKAAIRFMGLPEGCVVKNESIGSIDSELAEQLAAMSLGMTRIIRTSSTECYRCSCLYFMDRGFRRRFYLIESMTDDMRRVEREAYGKVIRTIAHEVNNSMAATRSILDITEGLVANESDFVEAIQSCKNRLSSLTDFITRYANVVKMPPLTKAIHDVNDMILRNIPFFEAMCAGTNVRITCRLTEEKVLANIDKILMEQVLVNIVKNAVESCNGNGEVVISTVPGRIEIADNGQGISPEYAEKMFSPFFSTKPNGQGIGLMFAGEILRRHGFGFSLATGSDNITRFTIIIR